MHFNHIHSVSCIAIQWCSWILCAMDVLCQFSNLQSKQNYTTINCCRLCWLHAAWAVSGSWQMTLISCSVIVLISLTNEITESIRAVSVLLSNSLNCDNNNITSQLTWNRQAAHATHSQQISLKQHYEILLVSKQFIVLLAFFYYSCDGKTAFSGGITPVSVTWSFRNHPNKNILLLPMLKTVVLLNIFYHIQKQHFW